MKITLNRPHWATKTLAGALLLTVAASAHAQPGQGGGQGGGGGRGGNFQNMTPEERATFMQRMEERRNTQRQAWLKQAMAASGVADTAVQQAVVDYMTSVETSKKALREQARALSASLVKPETTDADLTTALKAYRDAVAAANLKQATDLKALDATTKYSTTPRVETLLTLLGVIGGETSELGGIGEIFPESPYGAMGGGMGGRRGGGGGQGGPGGGGPGGPGGGGNPPPPPGE